MLLIGVAWKVNANIWQRTLEFVISLASIWTIALESLLLKRQKRTKIQNKTWDTIVTNKAKFEGSAWQTNQLALATQNPPFWPYTEPLLSRQVRISCSIPKYVQIYIYIYIYNCPNYVMSEKYRLLCLMWWMSDERWPSSYQTTFNSILLCFPLLSHQTPMASSVMFRRVITKSKIQSQHSLTLRLLSGRVFIHNTIISNTNNNSIVENGGSVNSYHCYSSQASSVGGVGLPSYMRGAVFWEPNKPLIIEEFHMPRPKSGEILIKTKGMFLFLLFILVFLSWAFSYW